MIPTQCHLWQKENMTWGDLLDFEIIKTYWDDSHFWRLLKKCKKCGQLYVEDTIEFVNYEEGDEIFTVIVPVSEKELLKYDFSKIAGVDLLENFRPIIFWTPDNKIKWIREE